MLLYDGYIHRICSNLADEYGLTGREIEVLYLLAKGRTSSIVAEKLTISVNTAKVHIYNIYQKLCVRTQQELIDVIEEAGKAGEINEWKALMAVG